MKVLIVNPGGLPVPDVKGGAVQSLTTELIKQNEKEKKLELYSIGPEDLQALEESQKYENTKFIFFKVPIIILMLDKLIYCFFSLFSLHPQSYSRILRSFYYVKMIKRTLKSMDFDRVVFEHNHLLLLSLKNKKLYSKYKDKYIIHIHNKVKTIKMVKPLISKCKHIFTVSEYMKKYLSEEKTLKIPSDSISVFYNCIEGDVFRVLDREKAKEILDLDLKNKKVLLFTGRINKEKGIEEVVTAFRRLDHNKYVLVVVGDSFYTSKSRDKYLDDFNTRISDLVDSNNILFTGYIDREQMPVVYNIADIVILPSMWDEPAGLTMLEAAFCEKKLITTNSGGIPEYVGDCSLIIDKENVVENLIAGIENIDNMSFDFQNVRMKFDVKNYYSEFCRLLSF